MRAASPSPLKEVSLWQGIMQGKCPHCREERMFPHGMYHPTRFAEMHKECPRCGQDLMIEPGYWFGAMYIGYGFNVALVVILVVLYFLFFTHLSPWWAVGTVFLCSLGLIPFNFRASRVLMIYFFSPIVYEPGARKQQV